MSDRLRCCNGWNGYFFASNVGVLPIVVATPRLVLGIPVDRLSCRRKRRRKQLRERRRLLLGCC
jgi:hypothetical protein